MKKFIAVVRLLCCRMPMLFALYIQYVRLYLVVNHVVLSLDDDIPPSLSSLDC